MWGYGLDGVGSGQGQVAGTCECGNEPSGSIKCGKFLDQLQNQLASEEGFYSMEYSKLTLNWIFRKWDQWRTEGVVWGVQTPVQNSEDIGGVLDRMSKKNRRLDFLLQFTVFSYGCDLLNKGFFNTNCCSGVSGFGVQTHPGIPKV